MAAPACESARSAAGVSAAQANRPPVLVVKTASLGVPVVSPVRRVCPYELPVWVSSVEPSPDTTWQTRHPSPAVLPVTPAMSVGALAPGVMASVAAPT